MKAAAKRKDFQPVAAQGDARRATVTAKTERIISNNVVGLLPGAKRPDETVIYSAHWDHLGIGLPDANGDRIYNGALDNGTGVAHVHRAGARLCARAAHRPLDRLPVRVGRGKGPARLANIMPPTRSIRWARPSA